MSSILAPHVNVGNNCLVGLAAACPFVKECQSQTAHLGPPVKSNNPTADRATHTSSGKEIYKHFNFSKCTKCEDCILPTTAGTPTVRAIDHPGKGCPKQSWAPASSHTTTTLSFETELAYHPDKAFTLQLLTALQRGVDIGYKDPVGPNKANNQPSTLQHPHVIDAELAKECAAGCILGPFQSRPLTNLRCSGVGIVPKKHNKWRMIMHLSAPVGNRIIDFIPRDDFSLHYTSIYDTCCCDFVLWQSWL